MTATDRKIINAVLQKCEKYCPGAIDILGVYGSAATGDTHSKSDLDLLIVCEEDASRIIADAFILDDNDVGYDIFCTPWSSLESDAKCTHANLAKLLDSKIIFSKDASAEERLADLREEAFLRLASNERFACSDTAFNKAKLAFAECVLARSLPQMRLHAAGCITYAFDALMLSKGKYFKLGVKRNFEELGLDEEQKREVLSVICAKDENVLKTALGAFLCSVKEQLAPKPFDAKPTKGTYEEMYSNWKGKVSLAVRGNDVYSAFMNMASFAHMLSFCAPPGSVSDAMAGFDPDDLAISALAFDKTLEEYRDLCEEAGVTPRRFANVDEFVGDYLK